MYGHLLPYLWQHWSGRFFIKTIPECRITTHANIDVHDIKLYLAAHASELDEDQLYN